ncbi:MAG: hypothetical protein J7M39_13015 [Anaerolineae bacterium]|nr:hypothetical protein [Anaerolineae bacterium]
MQSSTRHPLRINRQICRLGVSAAIALLLLAACARPAQPLGAVTPTRESALSPSVNAITPEPTETLHPAPTKPPTLTPAPASTRTPLPTPTIRPTRTLTPTTTATATAQTPSITYFRASADLADPGDTIELVWESTGATSALLYKLMVSGQLPADGIDIPVSGTYAYTIPPEEQNWVSFLLYAWDDAGGHANATETVRLRCSYGWFFQPPPEDICPTAPLAGAAAEQHFEGGTMIWVEAQDAIYVLVGDPTDVATGATHWNRFEDSWDESLPERDPSLAPPEGRQQPIRGFGLIWRGHPEIQDQLGWATDSETGYTTILQRTTRYKYNAWYLLALDGHIWYLGPERSSWDKLTPTNIADH